MKNFLFYICLSLFFFNASVAEILHFKCTEKYFRFLDGTEKDNANTLMLLQIDTNKKLMREWSEFSNIFQPEWEITKVTEYSYYSNKPINNTETDYLTRASFNRWTGSYTSRASKNGSLNIYNCEETNQLY